MLLQAASHQESLQFRQQNVDRTPYDVHFESGTLNSAAAGIPNVLILKLRPQAILSLPRGLECQTTHDKGQRRGRQPERSQGCQDSQVSIALNPPVFSRAVVSPASPSPSPSSEVELPEESERVTKLSADLRAKLHMIGCAPPLPAIRDYNTATPPHNADGGSDASKESQSKTQLLDYLREAARQDGAAVRPRNCTPSKAD
jgi:hypothetical protein